MQNMIYDAAPYDILYYDANLDAYRTDRFAGWQNQPTANGTPMFSYGTLNYTRLTSAAAAPTPAPTEGTAATPAPSSGGSGSSGSGDSTPLIIAAIVVIVVVGGAIYMRRNASGGKPKDQAEE
ncbi:MAG: hypothetical protein EPO00_05795 [Chloroflexota bacterium]|nr:MAG: hypothetical protein EPO00_05795 [Chloroflexota bacterium]